MKKTVERVKGNVIAFESEGKEQDIKEFAKMLKKGKFCVTKKEIEYEGNTLMFAGKVKKGKKCYACYEISCMAGSLNVSIPNWITNNATHYVLETEGKFPNVVEKKYKAKKGVRVYVRRFFNVAPTKVKQSVKPTKKTYKKSYRKVNRSVEVVNIPTGFFAKLAWLFKK